MIEDKKVVETPLMKQYFSIKAEHPDSLLLFRVGDFYETFGEDAITASKVLGIVLTRRANGSASFVELAGFPHHSIDVYLPKLVRAGYKVAVCDQLEDPKLTKKIVKRGVTELVTPGIAYNDQLLNYKESNYLATLTFHGNRAGIALLDISTGSFRVAEGTLDYIELILSGFAPKEILLQKGYKLGFEEHFGKNYFVSTADEWLFSDTAAKDKLLDHFRLKTLKGFGVEELTLGLTAAGATLFYLEITRHNALSHLTSLSRIDEKEYVWIDRFTFKNLEIFNSFNEKGSSLIDTLDATNTPMGGRLLREWIAMPSKNIKEIESRQNVVEYFIHNLEAQSSIMEYLPIIGDLERIIAKASAGKISPRECVQLNRGLGQIPNIFNLCTKSNLKELLSIASALDPCENLTKEIARVILAEPASQIGKGDVISSGVDDELDELRQLARHSKDFLSKIQEREIERTGISSLKISYNNVFGFYLEVRNTHKDKVPQEWIRKQTLVSAERYITPELKEYEEKILGAEEKILSLESIIFSKLISDIQKSVPIIQKNSELIARVDVLSAFAINAMSSHYCRPKVDNSTVLEIEDGRHPVIEKLLPIDEEYIANSLTMNNDDTQIIILTGPNMAGKSALLRQTALIVLLAQTGSFVPAKSAHIGICDKIFTRVGASDNISGGESTFMVEMLETSTILHNLSNRSLVLLDEIGRGTSTYDGMSIAWAIVEYLHEHPTFKAKTLFATHYHELNDLALNFKRVKNFHITVKEINNNIVFLRKLAPGGVEHSFGIHVAKLAGMPSEVIRKSEKVLKRLEEGKRQKSPMQDPVQLSFYNLEDPLLLNIRDELKAIDINSLSPLNAFDLLRNLKKKLGYD